MATAGDYVVFGGFPLQWLGVTRASDPPCVFGLTLSCRFDFAPKYFSVLRLRTVLILRREIRNIMVTYAAPRKPAINSFSFFFVGEMQLKGGTPSTIALVASFQRQ